MSFTSFVDGVVGVAAQVVQLIDCFNGASGKGQPLKLTGTAIGTDYLVDGKNLDTTDGKLLRMQTAGAVAVLDCTKDGLRFSPDGATGGLVPVARSGTETISGVKTFAAPIDFEYVAAVASVAGALTLPATGNIFQITGALTITSIVAIDGARVTLIFNSANCKVTKGSNLKLKQDFISVAQYDTLTLACDGTNWVEVGRGVTPIKTRFYLNAGQSISSSTNTTVAFDTVDAEFPNTATITNSSGTFTPPRAGWWRVTVGLTWDANSNKNRHAWLERNGSSYRELGQHAATNNSEFLVQHASDVVYTDGDDTFRVRVYHEVGAGVIVQDGSARTSILWEFLGG